MDEGLKALFALYSGKSWREISISEEEFAVAKRQWYLFDFPQFESHSESLERRKGILAQIDSKDIANAFLFSLSTRRLEYRSALGSYYYLKAVPEHDFMNSHTLIVVVPSVLFLLQMLQ